MTYCRVLAAQEDADGLDPCCLHDLVWRGEAKRVCCWRGDIYERDDDHPTHGKYLPKPPPRKR